MLKKITAALLTLLFAAVAFAAVDVNKATQAELEAVKGIGPAISGKILDERKKAPFKDWQDMVDRVKGVGEGNAAKFSTEGLTVNGAAFAGAPAKPTAAEPTMKKTDGGLAKPAAGKPAPMTTPAATATTASGAMKPATATAPASADDKRSAAAQAKDDKKAAKAAKAASAAEAKQAKAEKAAAKKGAKEEKPAAAATPASAAKK